MVVLVVTPEHLAKRKVFQWKGLSVREEAVEGLYNMDAWLSGFLISPCGTLKHRRVPVRVNRPASSGVLAKVIAADAPFAIRQGHPRTSQHARDVDQRSSQPGLPTNDKRKIMDSRRARDMKTRPPVQLSLPEPKMTGKQLRAWVPESPRGVRIPSSHASAQAQRSREKESSRQEQPVCPRRGPGCSAPGTIVDSK